MTDEKFPDIKSSIEFKAPDGDIIWKKMAEIARIMHDADILIAPRRPTAEMIRAAVNFRPDMSAAEAVALYKTMIKALG